MSCNNCGGGHYKCLNCGNVGCEGENCPTYFFETGFFSKGTWTGQGACCACGSEDYEALFRTIPPQIILLVLFIIYLFIDYNLDWSIFLEIRNFINS